MKVTVAPGDGIGPEVMDVTLDAFAAAGVPLRYERVAMGRTVRDRGEETGIGLEARRSVEETGVLLRGPMAPPPGGRHDYVDVAARQLWDAFATKHVYRMHRGVPAPIGIRPLQLTMVRESPSERGWSNGGWREREPYAGTRLESRATWLRLHRYAFEVAQRKGLKRVTCAHRARAGRITDGMFRSTFYDAAREFPELVADDIAVDRLAHRLVAAPESFDVIVLPDMEGDLLTDLATGLVGGLAYAPYAQIGDDVSIFGPVHGASESLVGRDLANPTAQLLAGTMMLRHVGRTAQARTIEAALENTLIHMNRQPDVPNWKPAFRTSVFRAVLLSEIRNELQGRPRPTRENRGAPPRAARRAAASEPFRNRILDSVFDSQLEGLA